ncbi:uncharacterized protein LOC21404639 [Morus notabilis]|uniref:uncharacterized protein LOC21404639 n=1 Tax=Morus notabilis TaxID=981085 RepID=UPI000CED43D1|nr:uncharacterized protein LOC21404639 [Morus notabilis]
MSKGSKHIDTASTRVESSYSILPTPPPTSSNLNIPVSATHRNEDFGATGFFSPQIFGHVPSVSEVEFAISVLRNFIQAVSSHGPGSNWLVQMLDGPTSRFLMSAGLRKLYDAFQLLEMDPSVKRLVIALATDKALWNAIMKNELVQNLRESLYSAQSGSRLRTIEEPELVATILQWIWEMSKAKVVELIDKFQALVNEMFQRRENEKGNTVLRNDDQVEDKVRSSLLLTIIILLIVVIARANGV